MQAIQAVSEGIKSVTRQNGTEYLLKFMASWKNAGMIAEMGIPSTGFATTMLYGGNRRIQIGKHTLVVHVKKGSPPIKPINDRFADIKGNKWEYVFLTPEDHDDCGTLVINNEARVGYISIVSNGKECISFEDGTRITEKVGTIMMQVMIEWCKFRKLTKIYLDYQSYLTCKLPHMSFSHPINLTISHTLAYGSTWYHTFGFKFADDQDEQRVLHNKTLHAKLRTSMVVRKDFANLMKETIRRYSEEPKALQKLRFDKIMQLFDAHETKLFGDFVKSFHRDFCDVFANCYRELFSDVGYKLYRTKYMVLVF